MPKLINAATGETTLDHIEIADTFWRRFKGLQFRRSLPVDTGLLLSPCSSLHTCFMRFPIDIIMLDCDYHVLHVLQSIQPWRVVFCAPGTEAVIETLANSTTVNRGDQVGVE